MKKLFWASGFVFLLLQTPAHAQSPRTWVASRGDDINPCSITSPCRTFAGALAKTAAGGIISVFDSGGYGALTISKSISIIAEGVQTSISTAKAGTAIIVKAGPSDVVNLYGLSLAGGQSGGNGIAILAAGTVRISHCLIDGYQTGVNVDVTAAVKVFVSDCQITQNDTGVAANLGDSEVVLDRVRLVSNQSAIVRANKQTVLHLNGSTLAFNGVAIGKVDGKILTSQNNALVGNGSDGQAMTPEGLK
jgi:hypothetical protein